MLVLSRKKGQRVRIGENIFVKVLEVHRDRVKLGFEAPLETPIHREEIAQLVGSPPPPVPDWAGSA